MFWRFNFYLTLIFSGYTMVKASPNGQSLVKLVIFAILYGNFVLLSPKVSIKLFWFHYSTKHWQKIRQITDSRLYTEKKDRKKTLTRYYHLSYFYLIKVLRFTVFYIIIIIVMDVLVVSCLSIVSSFKWIVFDVSHVRVCLVKVALSLC